MEIRRYQPTDLAAVWALHVIALEHAGAYAKLAEQRSQTLGELPSASG